MVNSQGVIADEWEKIEFSTHVTETISHPSENAI